MTDSDRPQAEEYSQESKGSEDQAKENPAETREWDSDAVGQANENKKESLGWDKGVEKHPRDKSR